MLCNSFSHISPLLEVHEWELCTPNDVVMFYIGYEENQHEGIREV